jgi:hypothetical protein
MIIPVIFFDVLGEVAKIEFVGPDDELPVVVSVSEGSAGAVIVALTFAAAISAAVGATTLSKTAYQL